MEGGASLTKGEKQGDEKTEGVYPYSSNIGVLRSDIGEGDVDEEAWNRESLCMNRRKGFGELVFLGRRQETDVLHFIKRHFGANESNYWLLAKWDLLCRWENFFVL